MHLAQTAHVATRCVFRPNHRKTGNETAGRARDTAEVPFVVVFRAFHRTGGSTSLTLFRALGTSRHPPSPSRRRKHSSRLGSYRQTPAQGSWDPPGRSFRITPVCTGVFLAPGHSWRSPAHPAIAPRGAPRVAISRGSPPQCAGAYMECVIGDWGIPTAHAHGMGDASEVDTPVGEKRTWNGLPAGRLGLRTKTAEAFSLAGGSAAPPTSP